MTPQEYKNRIVGLINLFYGSFGSLVVLLIFASILHDITTGSHLEPERGLTFSLRAKVFLAAFGLLVSLPSLIAGYGLLRRRDWAQAAGVMASFTALINFPAGTILFVYSLLFLLSRDCVDLYDESSPAACGELHVVQPAGLSAASPWYVPPRQMPDWRNR